MTSRDAQQLLSTSALTVFRLNGQFLGLAERLSRPVGLTAAWWQVLGAVLPAALPVSGIAREMGITRQAVQRIADLLVDRGLCEYQPNPVHRRAKLLSPTEAGRAAVKRIDPAHAVAAAELVDELGAEQWASIVAGLQRLSAGLDVLEEKRGATQSA